MPLSLDIDYPMLDYVAGVALEIDLREYTD